MELGYWKLVLLVCQISCLLAGVRAGVDSQNTSKLVAKLSSQEMAGLQALWEAWRNNTPHPERNLDNWGSTSDPCGVDINLSWTGVECTPLISSTGQEYYTVTSLSLDSAEIAGVLPFEISLLMNLEMVSLQTNKLIGQVPDVSNLTKLLKLDLSNNNFMGPIPNFTTIRDLTILDLSHNNFTGPAPNFTALPSLYFLDLSNNNFMGPIPNFTSLPNLTILLLSNNNFTGPIPDFTTLTNLTILTLANNNFTGPSPNFTTLPYLTILNLSNTNLTGPAPNFTTLTDLSILDLSHNNFTGPAPNFTTLPYLTILNLSNNNFMGPAPNFTTLPYLTRLDLSNNNFTGPLPNMTTFQNLRYLNLSNNNLMGSISILSNLLSLETLDLSNNNLTRPLPNIITLPSLRYLNLSNNNLMGSISSFSNLLSLETLDLSNNNLRGPLPNLTILPSLTILYLDKNNITSILDIGTFTNIALSNISKNLKVLNMKDNMITKVVTSKTFFNGRETKIFLQGNPYCSSFWSSQDESTWCSIYCEQLCTYLPKANNNLKLIIMASSTSFAIVLMLVILSFAFILHRNRKHIRHLQKQIKKANINTKWFEYTKLRIATKNFAPEMKLGAGAYGAVYKGVLENNIEVAVKQLFLETNKGKEDFLNEILLISNLQHQNLVTLKGYCLHRKQTLLVYEYVDNCDLDKLLFSRYNCPTNCSSNCNEQVLSWQVRLKICQGVAQGLYYLHASSQSRIIHRDIKASNILLDKNLHPKIADFGLARPIEDAQSVILTQQCAGTFGYLAPEYMCNGQLSDKADVFSFGVLLLEIVSGKRNRDLTMPEDEVYLPTRAWKLHKDKKIMDLKDATLLVSDNEVLEVQRVLEVAIFCVQSAPKKRPSMYLVAAMLTGNANVDISLVDKNHSWPENFVHE